MRATGARFVVGYDRDRAGRGGFPTGRRDSAIGSATGVSSTRETMQ
jgi:hypothetical protein